MEHYTFRTYRAVWNWQHKFYSLAPGMPLWWPVTFTYIGCLVLSVVVVWILLATPPARLITQAFGLGLVPHIGLPFLLAHWLTKASLDGKSPFSWARSQMRYLIRPRTWQRERPVAEWWLVFPPVMAYRIWHMLGWNPLPPMTR